MAWTKLDDGFADHPKVAPLSDPAFRAFVAGLCFANRYLTDGVLPGHAVAKIATAKVHKELVAAGLWRELEDGGVSIHDFLEYTRDAETVKAERRANADRQKRWRERHRNGVTNAVSNGLSNGVSNGTPSRPDPTSPDLSDFHEGSTTSALDVAGVPPETQADVERLLAEVRDRSELGDTFILTLAAPVPEAVIALAFEALQQRRRKPGKPLTSESKY